MTAVGTTQPWRRSASVAQVQDLCPGTFYPHELDRLDRAQDFAVTYRTGQIGPITLGDITYGADVRLDFDELASSYHVNIPVRGSLQSRHRGTEFTSTPDLTAVYQPAGRTVFTRWAAGCRMLAVKFDRAAIDGALTSAQGAGQNSSREFASSLNLKTGPGRSWAQLILMLGPQLGDPETILGNPLVAAPLAESLINGFLLLANPGYREAQTQPVESLRPIAVRTAIDVIESAPDEPWTTATLAARCHTSTRSLQKGFRQYLNLSPMAYLSAVRLRRAHQDLRAADPHERTVASIAHQWGFTHLGRFAAAYRQAHGELPTRTLRRSS